MNFSRTFTISITLFLGFSGPTAAAAPPGDWKDAESARTEAVALSYAILDLI